MGYYKANGRFADTRTSTFVAAGTALTTTVTSAAHELGDRSNIRIDYVVTAATGSPSVTCAVETSKDGVTWVAVASFSAITGAGSTRKIFGPLDRFVHIVETFSGSGSLTRSVIGEST